MADSAKASKIAEGRRLLTIASSSKSTPSQRLAFHRFLLSLRSTSSFEDKAYFAQNIARYFPEFEDLQDEAIDGLLDLCEDEDERARMEGIKGLGETGRVEPRWVKGNAGVLLQLLACPPKELALVHSALLALLDVAPGDVFEVVVDDCKASEGETGASRGQIIDYLSSQSVSIGERLIRIKRDSPAQRAIQMGFTGVLPLFSTTEKRVTYDLLLQLPALNGRESNENATAELLRSLRDTTKGDDPNEVKLLAHVLLVLEEKRSNVDARWFLVCLAKHGERLAQIALEEKGGEADEVIHALDDWVYDAAKLWRRGRDAAIPKDLYEQTLVKETSTALIAGLLEYYRSKSISDTLGPEKALFTVERLLLGIHQLLTAGKDSRGILSGRQQSSFSNMAKDANREKERTERDTRARDALRHISDAATNLADEKQKLDRFRPTSESRSKAEPVGQASAASMESQGQSTPAGAPRRAAESGEARRSGPPPAVSVTTVPPPVRPPTPPRDPEEPTATSTSRPPPKSVAATPVQAHSAGSSRPTNGHRGQYLEAKKPDPATPSAAKPPARPSSAAAKAAPNAQAPAATPARQLSIIGRAQAARPQTPATAPPAGAQGLAGRMSVSSTSKASRPDAASSGPSSAPRLGPQGTLAIRNAAGSRAAPQPGANCQGERSLLSRLAPSGAADASSAWSGGFAPRSLTPTHPVAGHGMLIRNSAWGSTAAVATETQEGRLAASAMQGQELLPGPREKRPRPPGDKGDRVAEEPAGIKRKKYPGAALAERIGERQ